MSATAVRFVSSRRYVEARGVLARAFINEAMTEVSQNDADGARLALVEARLRLCQGEMEGLIASLNGEASGLTAALASTTDGLRTVCNRVVDQARNLAVLALWQAELIAYRSALLGEVTGRAALVSHPVPEDPRHDFCWWD